jgi:hypothetical protein
MATLIPVRASGKAGGKWAPLEMASVYVDHPSATPLEHTLNIDLFSDADGRSRHVALELSLESAEAMLAAITKALSHVDSQRELAGSRRFEPRRITRSVPWRRGPAEVRRRACGTEPDREPMSGAAIPAELALNGDRREPRTAAAAALRRAAGAIKHQRGSG